MNLDLEQNLDYGGSETARVSLKPSNGAPEHVTCGRKCTVGQMSQVLMQWSKAWVTLHRPKEHTQDQRTETPGKCVVRALLVVNTRLWFLLLPPPPVKHNVWSLLLWHTAFWERRSEILSEVNLQWFRKGRGLGTKRRILATIFNKPLDADCFLMGDHVSKAEAGCWLCQMIRVPTVDVFSQTTIALRHV